MKGKIKNILSKKIFYVILGILLVGIVEIVYASTLINSKNVSYSNSSSKLSSTNVQGAIDELYKNCKDVKEECPDNNLCINAPAASKLIKKVVTSGDGLYQDEIESNKYFYRGKNPDNYINFNNELWRILNINQDGTIKIVKDGYYSTSMTWDTSESNDWARPANLNIQLNSTYYNNLNITAQNMINIDTWNIGMLNNDPDQSLTDVIVQEKNTIWAGKIALFTVSEYIRTNSNTACHTGPLDYANGTNGNPGNLICKNTTWLYDSDNFQWLLSPCPKYSYSVWVVDSNSKININGTHIANAIRPTLNLKSSVSIVSGSGLSSDPYIIK